MGPRHVLRRDGASGRFCDGIRPVAFSDLKRAVFLGVVAGISAGRDDDLQPDDPD